MTSPVPSSRFHVESSPYIFSKIVKLALKYLYNIYIYIYILIIMTNMWLLVGAHRVTPYFVVLSSNHLLWDSDNFLDQRSLSSRRFHEFVSLWIWPQWVRHEQVYIRFSNFWMHNAFFRCIMQFYAFFDFFRRESSAHRHKTQSTTPQIEARNL